MIVDIANLDIKNLWPIPLQDFKTLTLS